MNRAVQRKLNSFSDIHTILDMALAANGGEMALESRGQAIHWRQRAYAFRKFYAENFDAASPYDGLSFKISPTDERIVLIARINKPGEFRAGAPTANDDPLLAIALELAEKSNLL